MDFFTNIANIMVKYWKTFLLQGIGYTLLLSLIAVAGGAFFGSLMALAKRSKLKILKGIVNAIVEVVRGTPVLLQLYIGVFVFPMIVPVLSSLPYIYSVAIVLIINSSAYVSEIIRSGIEAVDIGQMEAARSLGLTQRTAMLSIVLPQAIKNILPALGNEFIMVVKETSLASTFFVGELMTAYLKVKGYTYLTMECLVIVGVLYFALTFILSKLLKSMERRMKARA
ncbi:MAG: amino acid ABC transporter permease [Oscillospiraceae bacterium]|nr:amino acid ABC transporter permease [Oscillospiraceae bacterium]